MQSLEEKLRSIEEKAGEKQENERLESTEPPFEPKPRRRWGRSIAYFGLFLACTFGGVHVYNNYPRPKVRYFGTYKVDTHREIPIFSYEKKGLGQQFEDWWHTIKKKMPYRNKSATSLRDIEMGHVNSRMVGWYKKDRDKERYVSVRSAEKFDPEDSAITKLIFVEQASWDN